MRWFYALLATASLCAFSFIPSTAEAKHHHGCRDRCDRHDRCDRGGSFFSVGLGAGCAAPYGYGGYGYGALAPSFGYGYGGYGCGGYGYGGYGYGGYGCGAPCYQPVVVAPVQPLYAPAAPCHVVPGGGCGYGGGGISFSWSRWR